MDRRAAARRDGLLHRQPGDLVPEPQPSAVGGEQPARQQLVDGRRGQPAVASSSPASTRAPVSAATSSSCLASAPRPAARASTASRAEAGTSAIPARSTSVT